MSVMAFWQSLPSSSTIIVPCQIAFVPATLTGSSA